MRSTTLLSCGSLAWFLSTALPERASGQDAAPAAGEPAPSPAPRAFPALSAAPGDAAAEGAAASGNASAGASAPAEAGPPSAAEAGARDTGVAAAPQSEAVPNPPASAASAQRERPARAKDEGRSYAGQVAFSDAAAGGLLAGGVFFTSVCAFQELSNWSGRSHASPRWPCSLGLAGLIGGAAVFALVPPIIHLAHARPLAALASFALRTVVPGLVIYGGATEALAPETTVFALLASAGAAVLVDALVLTQVTSDDDRPRAGIVPTLTPDARGVGLAFVTRL